MLLPINGEGELSGQLGNPGSTGKWLFNQCVKPQHIRTTTAQEQYRHQFLNAPASTAETYPSKVSTQTS